MITPPTFGAGQSYGELLGDADFWRPYAESALIRSGLAVEPLTSGFVGTYPTLLGTSVVIKLFGWFGDWRSSFAAERAANRAIADDDEILAPEVIASGALFPGRPDDWPYLISRRLRGRAWRDATLSATQRLSVAAEIGRLVRRVHGRELLPGTTVRDDQRAAGGAAAVQRQRRWGSLPDRLIEQVPAYLSDYRPSAACLVHADLTEDHLFVEHGSLVGVIDWGDAMITDPYYELGALHLGAFAADRRLLGAFLTGYGWPVDETFARHTLQITLMHEFDLFAGAADHVARADTLSDLAASLWQPL